jgi:hypothetical protein
VKTITATHASRAFAELLDRVERGETIHIIRDGQTVILSTETAITLPPCGGRGPVHPICGSDGTCA